MKTYNNLEELKKDIVYDALIIDEDIEINFDLDTPNLNISVEGDIKAKYIKASSILACNIEASGNIFAENYVISRGKTSMLDFITKDMSLEGHIKACYLSAKYIYAKCIKVRYIEARNLRWP